MHKEFLSYLSLFQIHCRSISSHLPLLRRGVRGQLYLFSFLSQWHMGFAWIIRKFLHYFWVSVNSLGYALVHIGFNHFCFESDPWVFFISGNFSCSIYLKFFFSCMCSSLLSQEQLFRTESSAFSSYCCFLSIIIVISL